MGAVAAGARREVVRRAVQPVRRWRLIASRQKTAKNEKRNAAMDYRLPSVAATIALLAAPALAQQPPPRRLPLPGIVYPLGSSPSPRTLSPARAVELALAAETAVQLAAERREEARGRALEARAALLPSLSGTATRASNAINLAAQGLSGFAPGLSSVIVFDTFDARLQLAQRLFDWSAIQRYRAGQTARRAAELEARLVRRQVTGEVLLAYLGALRAQAVMTAAEREIGAARALVALTQEQRAVGLATQLDVIRAGVRLAEEEARRAQAVADLEQAQARLRRLMALPPEAELTLTGELRFVPSAAPDAPTALAAAQRDRLEAELAQVQREAVLQEQSAVAAEQWPSVEVFADYGVTGVRPNRFALPTRTFGARVNVPIFNGGATFGRLVAEKSRARQSALQVADARRQIEQDVRLALALLSAAAEQVSAAEQTVTLAQREAELAEERFAAGVADNLEVVRAQAALSQARTARVQALAQHVAARINLALALGAIEQFQW
ncbi:MAG: hypothetical protein CFK52_02315 [Chloracidobacterium sp. CP2_5A]|nr:MAG: hypothetical protein CFK52_02315 [Chloracidobacterium sp. CP2_5A]